MPIWVDMAIYSRVVIKQETCVPGVVIIRARGPDPARPVPIEMLRIRIRPTLYNLDSFHH